MQWGVLLGIGFYLTNEDVGIFSTVQRLSYLVNFILLISTMFTSPRFAIYHSEGRVKDIEALAVKSANIMTIILALTVPILIIVACVLFSKNNMPNAFVYFTILVVAQILNVMTGSVAALLNMTGHEKERRNIMLISFFITVVLFIILTNIFGLIGAVISTAFGLSLQNILSTYKVHQVLEIKSIPTILHRVFYKLKIEN